MVRRENSALASPDLQRITPEYKSVLKLVKKKQSDATQPSSCWTHLIPYIDHNGTIQRVSGNDKSSLEAALHPQSSRPLVVSDAIPSQVIEEWKDFKRLCQDEASKTAIVSCNDRAPARHADMFPGNGGNQQTIQLRLTEYLDYVQHHLPESLDSMDVNKSNTPFYLNGWKAFDDLPSLRNHLPKAFFDHEINQTKTILDAVNSRLFGSSAPASSTLLPYPSPWCESVVNNLTKLFIGPPGCTTRLHYDAGEAHGWLAQLMGRKLFILVPPSSTPLLHPLASEKETQQSPIDPLHPDVKRWPSYKDAKAMACILNPGEAILIPKGWWHYAVSLDRSITLQRNFYHAPTNAGGLVRMVVNIAAAHITPKKKANE